MRFDMTVIVKLIFLKDIKFQANHATYVLICLQIVLKSYFSNAECILYIHLLEYEN